MEKQCKKCKSSLPIELFYYYKATGYSPHCKECEKAEKRTEYLGRKDKVLKTVHLYRDKNRDLINSRMRGKYKNNKEYQESTKSYQKEYRKTHSDKINKYASEYRAKNRDAVNRKRSDYAKTIAGKEIGKRRDYVRRAAKKNARLIGRHTHEEWLQVLKRFDYSCAMCGSKQKITQDHICPISKGGGDNIENLQPLCVSCNSSKNDRVIPSADGVDIGLY